MTLSALHGKWWAFTALLSKALYKYTSQLPFEIYLTFIEPDTPTETHNLLYKPDLGKGQTDTQNINNKPGGDTVRTKSAGSLQQSHTSPIDLHWQMLRFA